MEVQTDIHILHASGLEKKHKVWLVTFPIYSYCNSKNTHNSGIKQL